MKGPARRVSMVRSIVCPRCEVGALEVEEQDGTSRCGFCHRATSLEVYESLARIAALPDAVGTHACECGHPEMRLLPDGVFWCPSCGSEVLPIRDGLMFSEDRPSEDA